VLVDSKIRVFTSELGYKGFIVVDIPTSVSAIPLDPFFFKEITILVQVSPNMPNAAHSGTLYR
jgi:hypothetical protein